MTYNFTIGRPTIEENEYSDGPKIHTSTEPVSTVVDDPESVHADEYEAQPYEGSSSRMPSYTTWKDVCDRVESLGAVWDSMQNRYVHEEWVPVAFYEDEMGEILREAKEMLEDEPRVPKKRALDHDPFDDPVLMEEGSEQAAAALRALWFVRWSREAQEQFGDRAVFEVPGEWG